MPFQNRVTPWGEIVAVPARGTLMGNRGGRHHDPVSKRLIKAWASRRWIACALSFKDLHHEAMGEGYTSLFFLDEVTALAAGHRPCFFCRRPAASNFLGRAGFLKHADDFDRLVHGERLDGGRKRTFQAETTNLPDGAMIEVEGEAYAIRGPSLLRWQPHAYVARRERFAGQVKVLTPPVIVSVLASGYRPAWHPSAGVIDPL
jgi:hypothetical protein